MTDRLVVIYLASTSVSETLMTPKRRFWRRTKSRFSLCTTSTSTALAKSWNLHFSISIPAATDPFTSVSTLTLLIPQLLLVRPFPNSIWVDEEGLIWIWRHWYPCSRWSDFPRRSVICGLYRTYVLTPPSGHYITEVVAETGCLVALDIMVRLPIFVLPKLKYSTYF